MKSKIKKIKPHMGKLRPKKPTRLWYVDNLSSIAFGNAVSACLENYVYNLSAADSLDARVTSTLTGIMVVNKLYANTRDKSREIFNVDLEKSSSKKITFHDSLFCGIFTFGFTLGMYSAVTDNSLIENATNSAISGGIYTTIGAVASYNMDSFRDFFGVCENPNLPNKIKIMSSNRKKVLAAGIIASYGTIFSSNYIQTDDIDNMFNLSDKNKSNVEIFDNNTSKKINLETLIVDKVNSSIKF